MKNIISPARKRELLAHARELSQRLDRQGVQRSEWSHVVSALFRPAPGSNASIKQATTLLELLPTCGLERRGKRTKSQLDLIVREFLKLKKRSLAPEEWRFIVGWTSRYLRINKK